MTTVGWRITDYGRLNIAWITQFKSLFNRALEYKYMDAIENQSTQKYSVIYLIHVCPAWRHAVLIYGD